ncbi:MAG: helix-turn-helix domain-containing protein [Deltaproteobacteria bacterium]|nr:helix-turn-helix domain-containing protein [Deltaproteobacteria bacterium]MBN2671771.1 helix-turn-helix domain-containing protein [Deltaproteobacteria bacterium]
MQIDNYITPAAVLQELGRRVEWRRREIGITQQELASRCGVGKRTVERIEAGHDTQVSTLIKVMQSMGLGDRLEGLFPKAERSPMMALEKSNSLPRRIRKQTTGKQGWKWGDEE